MLSEAQRDRIALLVRVLRSGEYKQGRKALRRRTGGFCCLGVACDVYLRSTGDGEWEECSMNYQFRAGTGVGSQSYIPDAVRDWFGFPITDPIVVLDRVETNLTHANDFYFKNFEEIAAAIEETYLREEEDGTPS